MTRSLTVKSIFLILFAVVFGLALLLLGASHASRQAGAALNEANQSRYDSFLLATELRQSSETLTRLARSYLVTGDTTWRKQYQAVVDIRAGLAPRPEEYVRVHWDYLVAGEPSPQAIGPAAALLDRQARQLVEAVGVFKLADPNEMRVLGLPEPDRQTSAEAS